MDFMQAVWLAIIQGLSEFLPISSSAHLILPSAVLGWPDQGLAFDVAVHVGSLIAVVGYFRHDVSMLGRAWLKSIFLRRHSPESHLAWYIALATLPAALAGLFLGGFIEANLRSMAVIAFTTIFFGLLLAWADRRGGGGQSIDQFSWRTALVVGAAQALALIPGTSRSGITITAALALGFDRETAARFSFLLAIPVILLSGGYKGLQLLDTESVDWMLICVGVVLSAITAYLCITLFLKLIQRIGMMPFVIYRMLLGAVLIGLIYSQSV
ncbi:undecaprenyl-diphosphate phosphatase [Porticoccaceae bacterium]|nr:undecaprenyl-diphosphate phosphatase [Porticoccaceae bacterium]MDB0047748.1 undecaprenyl-diphosphate phosphatase [Porticoccaceae bacterium]MDB9969536.1 undecaprenyl-diphosphate phosphatase [Porticoccaceae bacterium]MDC1453469.1 undecaprenyl-diphosphate phosphatase [Porticoccaceae bacterium]